MAWQHHFRAAVVADLRGNPAGCDGELGGDSSYGVTGRGFASVLAD